MGKRLFWTALSSLMASAVHAAPPAPLPAQQLDWQPWGDQAPDGALCSGRYIEPGYRLPAADTPRQVRTASATAAYGDGGATILAGEVVLRRDDTQLEAPRVRVNEARDRAFAEGPTAVRYPGLLVRGGDASMALDGNAAQVNEAHYVIHEQRVRGDAVELRRLSDGRYRLEEASFTTCEPGNGLWRMVGSEVTLNRVEGFGTATHARLEMGDVPVFYWPWLRFPIDDRRQSGFLWPTLGFSSDGLDYTQPYYLNLAPNYDATLSPRWMSEHGAMLGGEFRYLFGSDRGTLEGAYLASDRGGASQNPNDPDDAFEGESRWYIDYRHVGRFSPRQDYQLAYGAASDGRYFDDFGRDFAEQDTDHLLRLARTTYRGDTWRLDARAQGYQKLEYPLEESDKPFYRLPSLSADARWRQDSGFYQEWNSNVTYFWRDIDEQEVPLRESATGSRVHLMPALGWRSEPSWGYLEPRAQLWQSSYQLDYGNRQTGRDESPSVTAPVVSMDSGLIFERDTSLFGNDWRQTLEPRLYYAYVPERDQSELPDFDTSERAVSWGQLWSPYRFTGADRLGDVNKLSYGASTRFLESETGRERLSLSVGQSRYFSNRNIDMNGDPDSLPDKERNYQDWYDATRDYSPVITQLDWQISERWRSRYAWFYDPQRSLTEKASAYLQYQDPAGHVLNLGYTWQVEGFEPADDAEDRLGYNREDYDVSFAYQALPSLDLIGRFLYDNTNDRALDELVGVQFNDCCAAVQLVWRKWIEDNDTANTIEDDYTDRGIFLRFVFKGLGGVGQGADSYFEEAIPGYRATRF